MRTGGELVLFPRNQPRGNSISPRGAAQSAPPFEAWYLLLRQIPHHTPGTIPSQSGVDGLDHLVHGAVRVDKGSVHKTKRAPLLTPRSVDFRSPTIPRLVRLQGHSTTLALLHGVFLLRRSSLTNQTSTKNDGRQIAVRRGRETSSPPQLGQRCFISVPQVSQKVHSKLQITAAPASDSGASQRSHVSFISSIAESPCERAPTALSCSVEPPCIKTDEGCEKSGLDLDSIAI